jgi:SAM-dependent methyltransferase
MKCLLCHHDSSVYQVDYFNCPQCDLIFKNPKNHLNESDELARYNFHQNDCNDLNYVNFLQKLLIPIESRIEENWTHLDFGSGKSSVFQKILKEKIQKSVCYDLFFFPDHEVLDQKYDLVTCSEVVEHFKNPKKDFEILNSVVKDDGYLAIMTNLHNPEIDFLNWWYKNDPTHVIFLSSKTISYIAELFQYEIFYNDNKSVFILKKRVNHV